MSLFVRNNIIVFYVLISKEKEKSCRLSIECIMNFSFKFVKVGKIGKIEIMIYGNIKIEEVGFCKWDILKCEIIEIEVVVGTF